MNCCPKCGGCHHGNRRISRRPSRFRRRWVGVLRRAQSCGSSGPLGRISRKNAARKYSRRPGDVARSGAPQPGLCEDSVGADGSAGCGVPPTLDASAEANREAARSGPDRFITYCYITDPAGQLLGLVTMPRAAVCGQRAPTGGNHAADVFSSGRTCRCRRRCGWWYSAISPCTRYATRPAASSGWWRPSHVRGARVRAQRAARTMVASKGRSVSPRPGSAA